MPPTATYHVMTVVLATVVLVAAVYGFGEDGWLRWFPLGIAAAGTVIVSTAHVLLSW